MREKLRDPIVWTDALRLVKTALAAVIAWLAAGLFADQSQSFLAPWAAILTVHATVFRTVSRGAQQVTGAVAGVLLGFVAATTLGPTAVGLGLVVLAGMVAGTTRALREESTTAATTAIVVLVTGAATDWSMLGGRLADTATGIVAGLLVNLLVWPPLHDRSAARRVDAIDDRLGELLQEMAAGIEAGGEPDTDTWVQATRELDHDIDAAWVVLSQARESGRLNLRRRASARVRAAEAFGDVLTRLEQAVAETRSMCRTIDRAGSIDDWGDDFRTPWEELLRRAGDAIADADADAVKGACSDLEDLAAALSDEDDERELRPVRAALLVNLRNILEEVGPVAEAQPIRPAAAEPV